MDNPAGHSPKWWRRHPEQAAIAAAKTEKKVNAAVGTKLRSKEKFNEILGILSFAFTIASWGWTVIAPDSSIWFGSVLLFLAVLATLVGISRIWSQKAISFVVFIIGLATFVAFDWLVVIKPQRGKVLKDLLVEGYHLSSECAGIPAHDEMPEWMRDQSKNWQTRVGELVKQKLDTADIQLWQGAAIVGLVSDTKMNAYQCTSLAVKIGALETLIATHYDPKLQHRNYNGPVYWFKAADGKVDISEALKNGNQAAVYIDSGDNPKSPSEKH